MSDKEFWDEINRIGISGETTQELVEFREPEQYHRFDDAKIPLHNVIMSNDKYAVIRKSYVYADIFGSNYESWSYYFCGISDEHKYFIRPMKNVPFTSKPTIEEVADWVNRIDDGFDLRIQGDVLGRFIKLKDVTITDGRNKVRDVFSLIRQKEYDTTKSIFQDIRLQAGSYYTITYNNHNFDKITDKPIRLGNHKLFVEGEVFVSKEIPFLCIIADSLILQHREHQIKELKIPNDSAVILAAQRGRDFYLGSLNFLHLAFD